MLSSSFIWTVLCFFICWRRSGAGFYCTAMKGSRSGRYMGYEEGSSFVVWVTSRGGGQVSAACWCSVRLMTEFKELAVKIRKSPHEKRCMIPRVAMLGCCCRKGVYESTFTISLAFVVTETSLSNIACNAFALATLMVCFLSFAFGVNTLPLATSFSPIFVWLLFDAYATSINVTSCQC